jgi:AraC-like DNA-binding protein/ligand-binding sensor protein
MLTISVKQPANHQLAQPVATLKSRSIPVSKQVVHHINDKSSAAPNDHRNGNGAQSLVEALAQSNVYQEYERAFTEATGLPVALLPVETWQLPHHGKRNENGFCALMSQKSHSCSACLLVQERLCAGAKLEAQTITCLAGLCDTAVPVRMGDRLIGFLHTGQVFGKPPTKKQFDRTARLAVKWGVEVETETLRRAYFATKVIPQKQHDAVVRLLTIFAQHLAMVANQIFLQHENAEPPFIKRAKEFIIEHQNEELSLGQVARAVNMSSFYFCKIFKKFTGINYTDYLSRVRIEKAKNLLLNPHLRVSEIAFEAGFQSLTHFNRVFKNLLGQSPTDYRTRIGRTTGANNARP